MPFRHVALYRWADHVGDDHAVSFAEAVQALRGLPGVRAVTGGPEAGVGGGSFDYVVVVDTDTEASWRAVRDHPTYILMREEHVTGHTVEQASGQFRIEDQAAVGATEADLIELSDDELLDRARKAAQASMDALMAEPDDVV